MLPKTTRGKGERDQRGFQYTTAHRILGLLPMPIVEQPEEVELLYSGANRAYR
jgi:hypothetical protein